MATFPLIKQTRIRLGLPQQQMAEMLGITRSLLSMAECGKRELSKEARAILFDILDKLDNSVALDPAPKTALRKADLLPDRIANLARQLETKALIFKRQGQAMDVRLKQAKANKNVMKSMSKKGLQKGPKLAAESSIADANLKEKKYKTAIAQQLIKASEILLRTAKELKHLI